MNDTYVLEMYQKLQGLKKAYETKSNESNTMLLLISQKLKESGGIVTKEINLMYKDRDVVLKNMNKISKKINKCINDLTK